MPRTIGYHWVKSGYGLWLPGDGRGHWSEAWDTRTGYVEPRTLHSGDPVRLRMARERMLHPPVQLNAPMADAVAQALEECVRTSNGGLSIVAAAIEPTHMHVLIPYSGRDIDGTVKWLTDRTTKAVHRQTKHVGPVWCDGRWQQFVFDTDHWQRLIEYIERYNIRAGRAAKPYDFLTL